jgi:hypothetical protein
MTGRIAPTCAPASTVITTTKLCSGATLLAATSVTPRKGSCCPISRDAGAVVGRAVQPSKVLRRPLT